ncbi:MAG TPA: 2OG-Fe(II) oxygenase family protein [Actinocrinis sp.]|uniref:2OG-Fe(II) oxygenase family protein n=1 Tax=Actinocrinis sp. TaxID=1920516 RepID=UPI002D5184EB|nr:2OG-Fe(II) oxygenase family protein [Actinocrinis sp.]HZU58204.1 2OG-Fe(II) oxygenase family protein [Actinocrinis sp.]
MGIPVLDLAAAAKSSPEVLREWGDAARGFGAFRLVNHGVPTSVRESCAAAARWFHGREASWKDRFAIERSRGNKGFVPADFSPRASGSDRVVRDYASLDFGAESTSADGLRAILLGPNLWPDEPGFRSAVEAYNEAVHACAVRVSRLLSLVCGLEEKYIEQRSVDGCSLLRLLHYPKPAPQFDSMAGGHTDYEWFTLLWQSAEGLEVYGRDGGVHRVEACDDSLIVLIGDLLEVLSGGRLESTLHWVTPREPDRYSLTYFYGPGFDELVAPVGAPESAAVAYPALAAGEHLTALRVRHFAHLRAALADGTLRLPFALPAGNPLKAAKESRLAASVAAAR